MLSRLLKEHQAKQNERKELQEKRRREAITAATCLTEALVDHLNVGYEHPPGDSSSPYPHPELGHWQGLQGPSPARSLSECQSLPETWDPRGPSVAQAYVNQRKLDREVKTLQAQAAQFAKQTGQWIGMVENFNQALKEIGDVENWARSIELDMRTIATALEYVYKGQLQSAPS
ncbi:biogenesis of lysosome-related organelles complex 1 subunit 1 isoform X1 [Oryctolagus cuniculus]|uniref:biogenesis of lysosome-related organelles complex 1 subunit 1 isoform X1 n=1 Tax=Oryctolagus cuniculus TaxID=9986 RepID=UPI0007EE76FA|nr:biogenesis of lysosome-related organelles complex 1 subunit 1 isoform X1 [Oryctolagus cuniculus]XP_051688806.1 biogenesis of lysosome-related organelles complex 1 subunit 1 isoform X1 [Oryctolagus cuniculus]